MDFIRSFLILFTSYQISAVSLDDISESLSAVNTMLKDLKEERINQESFNLDELKTELKAHINEELRAFGSYRKPASHHTLDYGRLLPALKSEKRRRKQIEEKIDLLESENRAKDEQIKALSTEIEHFSATLEEFMQGEGNAAIETKLNYDRIVDKTDKCCKLALEIKESMYALNDITNANLNKRIKDIRSDLTMRPIAFNAQVEWGKSIEDIGPGETAIFRSVDLNKGHAYSGQTGQFTAPVTGVYVFFLHITGSHNKAIEMEITKNKQHILLMYANGHGRATDSGMVTTELKNGDIVEVIKHGLYGDRPFYIHHGFSYFSGFLLSEIYE